MRLTYTLCLLNTDDIIDVEHINLEVILTNWELSTLHWFLDSS